MFLSLVAVGFVFDFVFGRGWLLPQESLWERKWRRNLGHGPPPSEPSTYSHRDDGDDNDDDDDKDDDDDDKGDNNDADDEPQHIFILFNFWLRVVDVEEEKRGNMGYHPG